MSAGGDAADDPALQRRLALEAEMAAVRGEIERRSQASAEVTCRMVCWSAHNGCQVVPLQPALAMPEACQSALKELLCLPPR